MALHQEKPDNKLNYFNADWAIGINRKVLQVYGLSVEYSKWRKVLSNCQTVVIGIILFFFVILPQTIALIKVRRNLNLVVDNLIINLPEIIGEIKLIIMWKYKSVLENILKEIEADWKKSMSFDELKVMIGNAKIGRIMTICSVSISFANVILYQLPLLFGFLIRIKSNLTDIPGRLIPIQTSYPYDITPIHIYCVTCVGQLAGVFFGTTMYTSTDALFATIILHLTGQLENLTTKINGIMYTSSNFQEMFSLCIRSHCQLLLRIKTVEQVFGMLILVLFALVAGTFCVQGYQLLLIFQGEAPDLTFVQKFCYCQFLCAVVFLMFIYNWTGENLLEQGERIHVAAYGCNWISVSHKSAQQIILLLLRSQQPLHIRAGHMIPLTLNTFLQFIKTSVGYINVLRATATK